MMRILFVDDQQRELDGMTHMINWQDMDAEVAGAVTDAREALEIAKAGGIDVVVTDVIMQNMDGISLLRALKEYNPHIRTICISGFDDFKFVSMALNNGASGYVLKPILVNEFREVLERVFSDIRKERAGASVFTRSLLALMCVGANDWTHGLSQFEKALPVRLAIGRNLADQPTLCRLDIADGQSVLLLGRNMPLPPDAQISDEILLCNAREAYLELTKNSTATRASMDESNEQDVVAIIKQNIENNLSREATTEMLMQGVYMSSGRANALFKNATGMTIHRYVIFMRLKMAAKLLDEQPDERVKDISWQCGFADASHLINSFTKVYGMTPEKYRRRHNRK